MKLVLARKVAAGVVVDDAMASYSRDFHKMRSDDGFDDM